MIMDIIILIGLVGGISWILRKVVKENFIFDFSYELCKVYCCYGW